MATFEFNVDKKQTVWKRYPIKVNAMSKEEAINIISKMFEVEDNPRHIECETINVGHSELLYDTTECIVGEDSVVVFDDEWVEVLNK